jgi:hypothetical protein
MMLPRRTSYVVLAVVAALASAPTASANTTPQTAPFTQDWVVTSQITTDDDWSGVPGIQGFTGEGLTSTTDVDPQTILGQGTPVLDVNANETNPNTFITAGVTEFETQGTVAIKGSGTADAPNLVFTLDTTGLTYPRVKYVLRDIESDANDSIQQVALQYRVGATGSFTNVPGGYVADASVPNATSETPVDLLLPGAIANQSVVQLRVITSNAAGTDEWIGIDDIVIAAAPDIDNDGYPDAIDNCVSAPNPDQANHDDDGDGDACDGDDDDDGNVDESDNCPLDANADQANADGDGLGDVCDSFDNRDDDTDTIQNGADNCPSDSNTDQTNTDGDDEGDA